MLRCVCIVYQYIMCFHIVWCCVVFILVFYVSGTFIMLWFVLMCGVVLS